ncbi:hypothetical protein EV426DRAFT_316664 [Tirmania nivea]|nr:hypothetical protein EV426DRAFT_316664 [Tirmania nivea]
MLSSQTALPPIVPMYSLRLCPPDYLRLKKKQPSLSSVALHKTITNHPHTQPQFQPLSLRIPIPPPSSPNTIMYIPTSLLPTNFKLIKQPCPMSPISSPNSHCDHPRHLRSFPYHPPHGPRKSKSPPTLKQALPDKDGSPYTKIEQVHAPPFPRFSACSGLFFSLKGFVEDGWRLWRVEGGGIYIGGDGGCVG